MGIAASRHRLTNIHMYTAEREKRGEGRRGKGWKAVRASLVRGRWEPRSSARRLADG